MSGRGTAGGVVFQSEVGACVAALLLSERPLTRLGPGLLGAPRSIKFETPAAVDDLLIETSLGEIYVQAKRTISLSDATDGDLASVADQFVRQFRSGIIASGVRRDLSPMQDRLVLAVGSETTTPVRENLRNVLDRVRTGAATALPKSLQTALDTFTRVLDAAWLMQTGEAITTDERQELLSVCAVVEVGHPQRQLVEDGLRDITSAGEEGTLIDLLIAWAATCAQNGVGGDARAIRQALIGKIRLREAPGIQDDVRLLGENSNRVLAKLQRFTTLPSPEGPVSFQRPVTGAVTQAVRGGSLALTGEPGAGKSAVIHDVALSLRADAMVVALTVEASATSMDALRQDLGLKHSVVEILSQITTDRPSFLVIDALDAVRGGIAEATYKRLVEEVTQLPGWRVLASIRTFDLRLGKEWKRLFVGTPPAPDHSDKAFPTVRHVHVGLLEEAEKQDIASQSPSLASAIQAGGTKLEQLARNPFNLALLGDLLRGGVAASTLSSVTTRGQLLDRYWEERVSDLGLVATTSLKSLVSLMLSARSIDVPETFVPDTSAAAIDELHRVGVLVTEATRRVAFRHHILFDFAVAKLILLPDQTIAAQHLRRTNAAGLLVVASLGYWFEELKNRLPKAEFWRFVLKIVGEDTFDPIVRVDLARLAVENAQADDAAPLADEILRVDPVVNTAFQHLAGSLISKLQIKQLVDWLLWADVLERMGVPKSQHLGSTRGMLSTIVETNASAAENRSIGAASRSLFDAMSADSDRIPWLAPVAIPLVAKTWGTDPTASRTRLSKIFEGSRFAKFAYVEVPCLARECLAIAAHDSDFVVELFYRAFRGANFSQDQVTSMNNSWIMGLNSNAAQDFQGAWYSLSQDFPKLLEKFPETGLRAFASALLGEQERAHSIKDPSTKASIVISKKEYQFISDMSCIWAWEFDESEYDNLPKMYQAVVQWASTAAATNLVFRIPDLLLREVGIALAWRALFRMGAVSPDSLGRSIWRVAIEPTVLKSIDTATDAIALVAATYPKLSRDERAAAEDSLLKMDLGDLKRSEDNRKAILGRLFEAIGYTQLVSEEALDFLAAIKTDGSTFENRRPCEFRIQSGEAGHWLEREGVDVQAQDVSTLLALAERVRVGCKTQGDNTANEATADLWQDVTTLRQAITEADNIDARVDQDVSDALADGLGTCLFHDLVPDQDRSACIADLMRISHHADPAPLSDDAEKNFADFPSWGTPSPRIEAAQKIGELACKPEFWPLVRDRFEALLLTDAHPAVRLQLVHALRWIYRTDDNAMWNLAERMMASEKSGAIIRKLVVSLSYVRNEDYQRVQSLIAPLESLGQSKRGDDPVTQLLISFAVDKEMAPSRELLDRWIENFVDEESRIRRMLFDLRPKFLLGLDGNDEAKSCVRRRTLKLIWSLVDALEPAVRSLPVSKNPPTQEEKVSLKLFGEIADQIFYAVGHDQLAAELTALSAKRQFLTEYAPLMSKLMTLGTPRAVHHLLSVLNFLIEADPAQCFDLFSEAMLRTTGVSRYEYESMGADLFVKMVGLYLADYRELFDDEERRRKLIDCIALFVETGWPEARHLFQSLPELLQ